MIHRGAQRLTSHTQVDYINTVDGVTHTEKILVKNITNTEIRNNYLAPSYSAAVPIVYQKTDVRAEIYSSVAVP